MEITSVKIQGQGYLLNGTMSVPNDSGNREYQAIQEWLSIKGNKAIPEFTVDELLEQTQTKFRQDRDVLLDQADILINKALDNNTDATKLRAYRQALRDATVTWIMPDIKDYE